MPVFSASSRGAAAALLSLALVAGCGADDSASTTGLTTTSSGAGGGGGEGGAGGGGVTCEDTGQRPSPRGEMAGILDEGRRRLVFFGGDTGFPKNCNPAPNPIGELWTYDVACNAFTQVATASGPGPRARAMAAYDAKGDRMLTFGGRYREGSSGAYEVYDDVWALDLEALTWTPVAATGTPPKARSNAAGAVNALTNELVLFGGNTSTSGASFTPQNDVWALDLATSAWRKIVTTGTEPSVRLFHSAAIDGETGTLYVYGGGGANAFQGPFYGDLWKLDLALGVWEELHDGKGSGAPGARIWSTLAFDADARRVLLFGGHDDGAVGNNNDTWAFDLTSRTWSSITAAETVTTPAAGFCDFPKDFTTPNLNAPDRRSAHLAGYDAKRGEWVVFGGKTDCGIIDDVWSFDSASSTWSRLLEASIGEACLRGEYPEQCTNLCL